MRFLRTILSLLALALVSPARASDESSGAAQKPGLFSRLLHPFGHSAPAEVDPGARGSWRRLSLTMTVEPLPLKLPETRQMKVTMTLANRSSRFVQLEFPTTQRIEVLVKNSTGKLVEQWSEDRAFTGEPGMVSINPGEHLVYIANVATRDMTPGETYSIEGFFPSYEALRAHRSIVPEK